MFISLPSIYEIVYGCSVLCMHVMTVVHTT